MEMFHGGERWRVEIKIEWVCPCHCFPQPHSGDLEHYVLLTELPRSTLKPSHAMGTLFRTWFQCYSGLYSAPTNTLVRRLPPWSVPEGDPYKAWIAQSVEHQTFNLRVQGSKPGVRRILIGRSDLVYLYVGSHIVLELSSICRVLPSSPTIPLLQAPLFSARDENNFLV
ncbi:unnamed protein product [Nezara viridula]|uniref:Uncharacterized protein n=1 Tax=Nezara viridula TaxID=85310 RepID=A0A9P0HF57_NEZVI|nr:unnamed protein product [Nezara viridula]